MTAVLTKLVKHQLETLESFAKQPRDTVHSYISNHDPKLEAHWKGIVTDSVTSIAEIASTLDWVTEFLTRTNVALDEDFHTTYKKLTIALESMIVAKWQTGTRQEIVYLDNTSFIKNNCWP